MDNIEREIAQKRIEIEHLSRMLDNAKRDLRTLEQAAKESKKNGTIKM